MGTHASRPFGPTRQPVASIGQGTWNIERARPADAVAALRHGIELGLTHIDTAEMYGDGAAERLVGKAIAGRRDAVYLVSKVLPSNASRRDTVTACERSLAHLGTDRLDCYLLHWRGRVPLAETLAAFDDLMRAGKIRAWGVSNFDVADLEDLVTASGGTLPACNQVLYHLEERAIEHAVLPWCATRGVAVVAYTPFGQRPQLYDAGDRRGAVLAAIAARHGVTPRAVALAFLLRDANVFTIPKAATDAHVVANAAACELALSARDIADIDAAVPRGKPPGGLPMI